MASAHAPGDFIAYPTDRVVGTIGDRNQACAAIEQLLQSGIHHEDIDILHGEKDLHRLDPTGEEHGFLAQFQRTLIRTAAPVEEYGHLSRHVEDVRAGRFVVMVVAKEPTSRDRVADILSAHGADFIAFYGRWAIRSMQASADSAHAKSPAGHTYEVTLGDTTVRLRFDDLEHGTAWGTLVAADGTVRRATGTIRQVE